jgi:hypothetical protein
MSELLCKCGHTKTLHGPFECDKCDCYDYTPATPAASQWLDKPTHDGFWWRLGTGFDRTMIVEVRDEHYQYPGNPHKFPVNGKGKFSPVADFPPPRPRRCRKAAR